MSRPFQSAIEGDCVLRLVASCLPSPNFSGCWSLPFLSCKSDATHLSPEEWLSDRRSICRAGSYSAWSAAINACLTQRWFDWNAFSTNRPTMSLSCFVWSSTTFAGSSKRIAQPWAPFYSQQSYCSVMRWYYHSYLTFQGWPPTSHTYACSDDWLVYLSSPGKNCNNCYHRRYCYCRAGSS